LFLELYLECFGPLAVQSILLHQVAPLLLAQGLPPLILFDCLLQIDHLVGLLLQELLRVELIASNFQASQVLILLPLLCTERIPQFLYLPLILDKPRGYIIGKEFTECLGLVRVLLDERVILDLQVGRVVLQRCELSLEHLRLLLSSFQFILHFGEFTLGL